MLCHQFQDSEGGETIVPKPDSKSETLTAANKTEAEKSVPSAKKDGENSQPKSPVS